VSRRYVILGGARTPLAEWAGGKTGSGAPGGRLKDISANALGAVAARGALERTGVDAGRIDHVIIGNALQTSGDAIYAARHIGLHAGVPLEVPALIVNRLCGSGIQSVIDGTHVIEEGARYVLCGGTESMSQAPFVVRGARSGLRLGHQKFEDSLIEALFDTYCGLLMAQTSDALARRYGITREDQDAYALRSVQCAERAFASGRLAREVVPVPVPTRKGEVEVTEDDHYYRGATLEKLAALKPAFGKDGMVTAGNASGMVDGAACLVVADAEAAKGDGLAPVAEVLAWHIVGVDPAIMGIGPVEAIRGVLGKTKLTLDDIDLFEINEAFAGQYLAVERELGLDRERVNVNGGAIALGHPLGATGARLLLTLVMELAERGAEHGIASACIGGGQGIAMLVRNISN